MKQQLQARGRMGSYAIAPGRAEHFYTPTIIDATNPAQSVSDNLNAIQSTLLNSEDKLEKKLKEIDAALAKLEAFEPWPVGCIYIAADNVNPAVKFGYGTWNLTSGGRSLVGAGGGKVLGQAGGATTVALTEANMPAHTHNVSVGNLTATVATDTQGGVRSTNTTGAHAHNVYMEGTTGSGFAATTFKPAAIGSFSSQVSTSATMDAQGNHAHTVDINHAHNVNISHGHTVGENSKGGNAAFNIESPYFVVNIWHRVA